MRKRRYQTKPCDSVQFYWISLLCSKYFAQYRMYKQTFGHNLTQLPRKFSGFLCIFDNSKSVSQIFKKNIKKLNSIKLLNLMVFCMRDLAC